MSQARRRNYGTHGCRRPLVPFLSGPSDYQIDMVYFERKIFLKFMKKIIIGVVVIGNVGGGYFAFGRERAITIGRVNQKQGKQASSIAGLNCDNAARRPAAVMMPSDPEARPLTGIAQADAVVEMPVTPNGVTRFMAVFQCQTPKEIGSIRSAREDFIPLAAGFHAVYAHWGGEHGALAQLNQHITENINALEFDGTIFYRKANIRRPHNGFTNLDLLFTQAKTFGYRLSDDFAGYPHSDAAPAKNLSNVATFAALNYAPPYNILWTYDSKTNIYSRKRGDKAEIDRGTGRQVSAKVIAVMHTTSHILTQGDQYIVVNTTGQGSADV